MIWIHNKTMPPIIEDLNNHENYISITNGTKSHLSIHKTVDSKLGMPYNECFKNLNSFKKNMTIVKQIEAINQTYTHISCLKLCFELNYIEENPCNCRNSSLGNIWLDCWIRQENLETKDCTYKYRTMFFENKLAGVCQQYCMLECDSISYFINSNNFETYDNATTLVVFYQSLQYTLIKQLPKMQPFDLVSSVGGTLSLFIGLSFVSLFEFSELLIEIAFIFYNKLKNPTQSKSESETSEKKVKNDIQTKPDSTESLVLRIRALEVSILQCKKTYQSKFNLTFQKNFLLYMHKK